MIGDGNGDGGGVSLPRNHFYILIWLLLFVCKFQRFGLCLRIQISLALVQIEFNFLFLAIVSLLRIIQ